MKAKQISILLIVVVIVGAIAFFVQRRSQSEWSESATPESARVLDFPVNDVARVTLHGPNGQLNIAKKETVWVVEEKQDYPANFERVSTLIRNLWELHPVQELKVGQSQFARLELTDPGPAPAATVSASPSIAAASATPAVAKTGTIVELKDKNGKTVAKLIAGKQNTRMTDGPRAFPMPAGRYVLVPSRDGGSKVSLVSQMIDVDTKAESWIKRDFVKVENPSSISLVGQTPAKHWTLTRADAKATDWKLTDGKPTEELDKPATISLGTMLSSSMFTDVLPPDAKPEQHGLDKPDVLTIQTFDGFTYTLKIGKADTSNYPVQVAVTANLAKERTPAPDEKPEDKAKKDEEFKTQQKKFEEKVASEKELEKRIYLMPKSTLDFFLKDRADLLAKKKSSPAPTPAPAPRKKR